MSGALPGEHLCLDHQGDHSHYAKHNCTVCKLQALVAQGAAVVEDLLKSTGGSIICQDYGRLNSFLVESRKAGRQ